MGIRNTSDNTKRLTVAAVCAALASVAIILTNFIPLRVSLLMAAALCYFVAFIKCGFVHGILSIAASILISFFTKPFSSAFFLTIIVFAPYSVIAYFCRKLFYTKLKSAIIRIAAMTVFAALAFMGIYFLAKFIDFDIMMIVERFTYPLVTFLMIFFAVTFDFLFNQLSIRLLKAIKYI